MPPQESDDYDESAAQSADRNVYGGELEPCSTDPETGYLRDGHCRDVDGDVGEHTLCAVMTAEFLEYSRTQGNDLITPRPEFAFPGLEPGDRWCVCVGRWLEAVEADVAPPVVMEATNESVLSRVDPDRLRVHEFDTEEFDSGTLQE
ncbi:DUF2237 domain-containing protein [Halorubrum luteum]